MHALLCPFAHQALVQVNRAQLTQLLLLMTLSKDQLQKHNGDVGLSSARFEVHNVPKVLLSRVPVPLDLHVDVTLKVVWL